MYFISSMELFTLKFDFNVFVWKKEKKLFQKLGIKFWFLTVDWKYNFIIIKYEKLISSLVAISKMTLALNKLKFNLDFNRLHFYKNVADHDYINS